MKNIKENHIAALLHSTLLFTGPLGIIVPFIFFGDIIFKINFPFIPLIIIVSSILLGLIIPITVSTKYEKSNYIQKNCTETMNLQLSFYTYITAISTVTALFTIPLSHPGLSNDPALIIGLLVFAFILGCITYFFYFFNIIFSIYSALKSKEFKYDLTIRYFK
ncbi:DUF4870 domain-containing protein [Bacillus bombysepticus]|uniref:DUF4870 domain-containing protein n=1 Tax=Bacillus bombysepticus TaxID=658666 RepID=UPI0030193CBD